MSKYFGTDGFRGEANVGLTVEHAYRIGRFLGWYYGRDGLGRRRLSHARDDDAERVLHRPFGRF